MHKGDSVHKPRTHNAAVARFSGLQGGKMFGGTPIKFIFISWLEYQEIC